MIGESVHILLVEDDDVDILNVTRAFKKHNIHNPLHVAHDGVEALDYLRGTNGKQKLDPLPKIILLDINMPRMNGLEFLREIRQDEALKSLSVYILTTSDDEQDKMAAYGLNVAGYIIKPTQFEEFMEAISVLNLYWTLLELP